ncbi:MAG: transcriptional regulator [Microbacterium sp.]|jgi:AcrR family transcriptional regulator|nr:transcriptional regulator [Microbacterium sp.]
MSPRRYASPLRQAEAARTRAAILDAAATLFSRDGYAATTMKGIASEAGVSVQSVHLAGSKATLLVAAFERTFAGAEGIDDPGERPAVADILEHSDAQEAMRAWLDEVTRAHARTAGLARAIAVAGETDAVAADAVAALDARRHRETRIASEWLVARGLLRPEHIDEVTDELCYLFGPDTFAFFVTRSAWTVTHYREWLERTLHDLLARRADELQVA